MDSAKHHAGHAGRQELRLADDAQASMEVIRLRAEVIAAFNDLAPAQQRSILDFYWKRLGNKLLPFVRRLATEPPGDKDASLRDLGLQRWCDFDLKIAKAPSSRRSRTATPGCKSRHC